MGPSRVSAVARRFAATLDAGRSISRATRMAARAGSGSRVGVDEREHALAREHESGVREADEMGEACDHKRQPECSATMPPVMRWNETRRKPAARIISANAVRPRKAADRFDQVAIGLGVLGDGAAERGDDVEGVEIVERVEARHVDGGKFQAEKAPARAQHAMGLGQRRLDARHVADAEGDGDGVVTGIGKRQHLGIAVDERDCRIEPALGRARPPDLEHGGIDVDHRRARADAAGRDHPEGDVAGAAGDIEQCEWTAGRPWWFHQDGRDGLSLAD